MENILSHFSVYSDTEPVMYTEPAISDLMKEIGSDVVYNYRGDDNKIRFVNEGLVDGLYKIVQLDEPELDLDSQEIYVDWKTRMTTYFMTEEQMKSFVNWTCLTDFNIKVINEAVYVDHEKECVEYNYFYCDPQKLYDAFIRTNDEGQNVILSFEEAGYGLFQILNTDVTEPLFKKIRQEKKLYTEKEARLMIDIVIEMIEYSNMIVNGHNPENRLDIGGLVTEHRSFHIDKRYLNLHMYTDRVMMKKRMKVYVDGQFTAIQSEILSMKSW